MSFHQSRLHTLTLSYPVVLLCVIVAAKNVDEAGQARRPNTNQCIISLDMGLWRVSFTIMVTNDHVNCVCEDRRNKTEKVGRACKQRRSFGP